MTAIAQRIEFKGGDTRIIWEDGFTLDVIHSQCRAAAWLPVAPPPLINARMSAPIPAPLNCLSLSALVQHGVDQIVGIPVKAA